MEIHVQLAGIQLGPYSAKQVRAYLAEGLLAPTDPAREEGTENWIPVNELLAKLPPEADEPDAPPEPASGEVFETPKRAPAAPPGVTHLPQRHQDSKKVSLPSVVEALAKKSFLIGPSAPAAPTPSGRTGFSTMTTSPLTQTPTPQGTKKMSRAELVKALAQKTAPLPSRPIPPPPPRHSPSPPPPATDAAPPEQPDGKKPVTSMLKSLTTKTVPIRSSPPPTPPSGTLPITTPLPTRPVFKPPSGTVPPPSTVHALTKRLGQVARPDAAPTSPPTLGLPVETDRVASFRKKAAEAPAASPLLEPLDEPSAPPKPRRILSKVLYVCVGLSLLLPYYVWSPYHATTSLWSALQDGDSTAMDAAVDFPSVRASLKEQIKAQAPSPSGTPGNSAATSNALAMIDHSIDLYITPAGIAGLVANKSDSFAKDDLAQSISPDVAMKLLLAFKDQPVRNKGLASLNNFIVQMDATALHLQIQGLGWKVKRIDLRPDLLMPASASPLLSPVVDTFMERGNARLKKNDWNGAIAEFSKILAVDPQSSDAYSIRAAARESKGDLDGAIKDYTQAITIAPQMATAYNGRGNAKLTKNDLDDAIADFTQAVQLDPTMAVAYDSRGNAKTAKDDLDGAIADYTQAIAIDPKLASAYSDRGFARQANGNLDGAISDYTQALALKPKTAGAYYNRGLARLSQGNLEAAIIDFDRALAFDPTISDAFYNRGNAKDALHDLDGAIADYTKAVALNPKNSLAFCNRGLARQAKGDLDGAVADYTQALAINPKIATAYYNRGLIEAQKNDLDGAIADNSQALYLDPKNAKAYYNRGFAKLIKGNLDGAMADLKQFCDIAPKDHNTDQARLYLWLIAKAQNSKTDVDQQLSDALENSWNSSPDDSASKTAAFLLGRTDEADYLASTATDAKTAQVQQCEAWYFSGMKRLLMGDRITAIDYFHKCLATGQKDHDEYLLAQAELRGLEPTAPPVPAAAAVPAMAP